MAFDIYQEITDRIMAELEKGRIPWRKPWTGEKAAISHTTGKPYSLLNQLLLGKPGEYITYKQAQEEGGQVKKGERSSIVVFWKFVDKKDENGEVIRDENGKAEQQPFLRYYNVFHIDQCEGISPKHSEPLPVVSASPDEAAEAIMSSYLERSGVKLFHEGAEAFYRPSTDSIHVPELERFSSTAEYYSTLFHEATHSTGHSSRLNRLSSPAYFGSEAYSKEELIAEVGAATLVHRAGLETPDSFKNSAAYIQSWLRALKDDKHLIVGAAGKAEKAVALILGE